MAVFDIFFALFQAPPPEVMEIATNKPHNHAEQQRTQRRKALLTTGNGLNDEEQGNRCKRGQQGWRVGNFAIKNHLQVLYVPSIIANDY
jgi:hypothetical protein